MATGQYTALAADDRVQANRILVAAGSGPELKGAAKAALDGPPALMRRFLEAGQFTAAQRDQDTFAQAAASARTAQNAAVAAQNAARQADRSAVWAQSSARQAAGYAQDAYASARQAYDSAISAGKSLQAAIDAANGAIQAVTSKIDQQKKDAQAKQLLYCADSYAKGSDTYNNCIRLATASDDQKVQTAYENSNTCMLFEQGSPDWVDINSGVTYDAIGPIIPPERFNPQWANIQASIINHMGKADRVPISIKGLAPDQVAKLQAFIQPLGSNVFLLVG